jgi:prepilin-type N-terminal cleavage/methylation domain-containing protein
MMQNGFRRLSRDTRGFTLVELVIVFAIIAVLAGLAVKTFMDNRKKSYDTQALEFMRNLLTAAETDVPTTFTTYSGAQKLDDYPQLTMNAGMNLAIDGSDPDHRIRFYLAAEGGDLGFYFWIPGEGCADDTDTVHDGSGHDTEVIADKIVPDFGNIQAYDVDSFRTAALGGP